MDLLFQPAAQSTENARRRHPDTIGQKARGGAEKRRLSGERGGELGMTTHNVDSSFDSEEVRVVFELKLKRHRMESTCLTFLGSSTPVHTQHDDQGSYCYSSL